MQFEVLALILASKCKKKKIKNETIAQFNHLSIQTRVRAYLQNR